MARRALPLAAALPLLAAVAAVPVTAAPSGAVRATAPSEVLKQGTCSRHSVWKITMNNSDGRIEVAFEVDQGKVGAAWHVTLKHNGHLYYSGMQKTLAPDGSFEVNRLVKNLRGVDTIKAVATNRATGETCVAKASF